MAKKIKIKVDRGSKQLVHKPVGPDGPADGQEIFRAKRTLKRKHALALCGFDPRAPRSALWPLRTRTC
jgi:hypothetical protein